MAFALATLLIGAGIALTCNVKYQFTSYSGLVSMTIPANTYVCFAAKSASSVFLFNKIGNASIYVNRAYSLDGTATYVTTINNNNLMGAFSFGYHIFGVLSFLSPNDNEISFTYHTYSTECDAIDVSDYPNSTYSLPSSSYSMAKDQVYCSFLGFPGNGTIRVSSNSLGLNDELYYYSGSNAYDITHNTAANYSIDGNDPFMVQMMSKLEYADASFSMTIFNAIENPDVLTKGRFGSYSDLAYICPNGTSGTFSYEPSNLGLILGLSIGIPAVIIVIIVVLVVVFKCGGHCAWKSEGVSNGGAGGGIDYGNESGCNGCTL